MFKAEARAVHKGRGATGNRDGLSPEESQLDCSQFRVLTDHLSLF
jgi:hypothetical protein